LQEISVVFKHPKHPPSYGLVLYHIVPCERLMSTNWPHTEMYAIINDKSQGSVVT